MTLIATRPPKSKPSRTRPPHPVTDYANRVLAGEIPAGPYVRQACHRHLADLAAGAFTFDEAAADRALEFFGFLKHSKGEWAGRPFALEPWQRFITGSLFGWVNPDGLRRFRTAYIEVPRKNGKTQLLAGLGLYLAFFDGEGGAEAYCAATKRDQAKICWEESRRMVLSSPPLKRQITALVGNLHDTRTNSKFMPLGADGDTMDGLNIHAAIVDELHAHKTRAIVDVLETATAARRQPLILYITTAGTNRTSVCYERHEYSTRVLSGTAIDETMFGYIAACDPDLEWHDEKAWAQANPNLHVSVKIDDLRRKAERAKQLPTELNAFKRLHLNIWTQQLDLWIDLDLWDANSDRPVIEAELIGRSGYGGLDLSATRDITAWVMGFPRPDDPETIDIVARFWCPEVWAHSPENRYADQYQAWARDGHLTLTEGGAIDYAFVKARVLADASRFRIEEVGFDRLFQGAQASMELASEGMNMFPVGQGFYGMAAPMKEFERRLLNKKLNHGGNPVLRFMAESFAVAQDPSGNLKPDKNSSQAKIDGIVALLMALERLMRADTAESVYESHGVRTIG